MSDEKMLPENQRGFAPTVKGIANSNAQVSIRQNGSLIYQVYVPPGAFIIDDLYPTSFGGDLDVTITESDGSTRSFKQPFSSYHSCFVKIDLNTGLPSANIEHQIIMGWNLFSYRKL
ncbi:hypothetical protein A8140_23765 (plasmid) [Vibrio campbellii CAIM 519 = NBRC 15631 = ATCC 25920]|nr:hypothetical protein A8140_23765 [Vibrio campbellii CAIM 519 = NBRC 15631 = ATCC 25920]